MCMSSHLSKGALLPFQVKDQTVELGSSAAKDPTDVGSAGKTAEKMREKAWWAPW